MTALLRACRPLNMSLCPKEHFEIIKSKTVKIVRNHGFGTVGNDSASSPSSRPAPAKSTPSRATSGPVRS